MKKNLRNILVLSLGLMTTSVFAQDWNVDSRTRIDMSGDNGKMITNQRATIGTTWGGSDWGIHVSSDVNYTLQNEVVMDLTAKVYEAYASTNLMGYATMTAGRQALDYGSGAIVSSNQWGARSTWDGLKFDLDVDVADITIGYAAGNDGDMTDAVAAVEAVADDPLTLTVDETAAAIPAIPAMDNSSANSMMYANLNKADGDWTANVLLVRAGKEFAGSETSSYNAMGLDVTYAMMDGKLNLGASYNTASETENGSTDDNGNVTPDETTDYDFMSISAAYNVSDNLTASVSQTTYGEGDGTDGFKSAYAGDMDGSWSTVGGLGYLKSERENLTFGISYTMDKFTFGASMHSITDGRTAVEAVTGVTPVEDDPFTVDDETVVGVTGVTGVTPEADRSVTEFSLGYAMSDNANLSLKYASDEMGEGDAEKYMWLTLNITP